MKWQNRPTDFSFKFFWFNFEFFSFLLNLVVGYFGWPASLQWQSNRRQRLPIRLEPLQTQLKLPAANQSTPDVESPATRTTQQQKKQKTFNFFFEKTQNNSSPGSQSGENFDRHFFSSSVVKLFSLCFGIFFLFFSFHLFFTL